MSTSPSLLLKPNDRIVFLGDSITEQQLYTNYVETYLATRFPELKLSFFNAGWGGDTAPGGAQRLDRDVLALQPTVVTLCYGMNDGRYTHPSEDIRSSFVTGMKAIVACLKDADVRVVLLTPGMFDETVRSSGVDYNLKGLRILADEVLALAAAEQLPVADLHRLMNEVDQRAKAADPKYSMVPDAVHPDPAGHLVMAYGLLQALGVPPRRQELTVDLTSGRRHASPELAVRRFQRTSHGFALELGVDKVPFFVEPAARKVLPFLPFQETYNQLLVTVSGVTAKGLVLRTQTLRTPPLSQEAAAGGFNLFSLWGAPPVQHAASLLQYTQEKDQVYYKLWRPLGLQNLNSGYYNAAAHRAGIRILPTLDQARNKLLTKAALTCQLNFAMTDVPGEGLLNGDFISLWSLIGPFPKPYDTDRLGGEAAFSAAPPRAASDWLSCDAVLSQPGNALNLAFGQQGDCFAYAVTVIESPVEQAAELLLGSDDGFAVWLNGEARAANLTLARGVTADQERIPVRLRAGKNVLLLKITQGGGNWGFCARFGGLAKPVAAQRP